MLKFFNRKKKGVVKHEHIIEGPERQPSLAKTSLEEQAANTDNNAISPPPSGCKENNTNQNEAISPSQSSEQVSQAVETEKPQQPGEASSSVAPSASSGVDPSGFQPLVKGSQVSVNKQAALQNNEQKRRFHPKPRYYPSCSAEWNKPEAEDSAEFWGVLPPPEPFARVSPSPEAPKSPNIRERPSKTAGAPIPVSNASCGTDLGLVQERAENKQVQVPSWQDRKQDPCCSAGVFPPYWSGGWYPPPASPWTYGYAGPPPLWVHGAQVVASTPQWASGVTQNFPPSNISQQGQFLVGQPSGFPSCSRDPPGTDSTTKAVGFEWTQVIKQETPATKDVSKERSPVSRRRSPSPSAGVIDLFTFEYASDESPVYGAVTTSDDEDTWEEEISRALERVRERRKGQKPRSSPAVQFPQPAKRARMDRTTSDNAVDADANQSQTPDNLHPQQLQQLAESLRLQQANLHQEMLHNRQELEGQTVQLLQDQLQQERAVANDLRAHVQELTHSALESENANKALVAEIEGMRKAMNQMSQSKTEMEKKLDNLDQEMKNQKKASEMRQLKKDRKYLLNESQALECQKDYLDQELQRLNKEQMALQYERKALSATKAALLKERRELEEERRVLERDFQEFENEKQLLQVWAQELHMVKKDLKKRQKLLDKAVPVVMETPCPRNCGRHKEHLCGRSRSGSRRTCKRRSRSYPVCCPRTSADDNRTTSPRCIHAICRIQGLSPDDPSAEIVKEALYEVPEVHKNEAVRLRNRCSRSQSESPPVRNSRTKGKGRSGYSSKVSASYTSATHALQEPCEKRSPRARERQRQPTLVSSRTIQLELEDGGEEQPSTDDAPDNDAWERHSKVADSQPKQDQSRLVKQLMEKVKQLEEERGQLIQEADKLKMALNDSQQHQENFTKDRISMIVRTSPSKARNDPRRFVERQSVTYSQGCCPAQRFYPPQAAENENLVDEYETNTVWCDNGEDDVGDDADDDLSPNDSFPDPRPYRERIAKQSPISRRLQRTPGGQIADQYARDLEEDEDLEEEDVFHVLQRGPSQKRMRCRVQEITVQHLTSPRGQQQQEAAKDRPSTSTLRSDFGPPSQQYVWNYEKIVPEPDDKQSGWSDVAPVRDEQARVQNYEKFVVPLVVEKRYIRRPVIVVPTLKYGLPPKAVQNKPKAVNLLADSPKNTGKYYPQDVTRKRSAGQSPGYSAAVGRHAPRVQSRSNSYPMCDHLALVRQEQNLWNIPSSSIKSSKPPPPESEGSSEENDVAELKQKVLRSDSDSSGESAVPGMSQTPPADTPSTADEAEGKTAPNGRDQRSENTESLRPRQPDNVQVNAQPAERNNSQTVSEGGENGRRHAWVDLERLVLVRDEKGASLDLERLYRLHQKKVERLRRKIQQLQARHKHIVTKVKKSCMKVMARELKEKNARLDEERQSTEHLKEAVIEMQKQLMDMERELIKAHFTRDSALQETNMAQENWEQQKRNMEYDIQTLGQEKEELLRRLTLATDDTSSLKVKLSESEKDCKLYKGQAVRLKKKLSTCRELTELCHHKFKTQRELSQHLQKQLDDVTTRLASSETEVSKLKKVARIVKHRAFKRKEAMRRLLAECETLQSERRQETEATARMEQEKRKTEETLKAETLRYQQLLEQVEGQQRRLTCAATKMQALNPGILHRQMELRFTGELGLLLTKMSSILDRSAGTTSDPAKEAAEQAEQEREFRARVQQNSISTFIKKYEHLMALKEAAQMEARLLNELSNIQQNNRFCSFLDAPVPDVAFWPGQPTFASPPLRDPGHVSWLEQTPASRGPPSAMRSAPFRSMPPQPSSPPRLNGNTRSPRRDSVNPDPWATGVFLNRASGRSISMPEPHFYQERVRFQSDRPRDDISFERPERIRDLHSSSMDCSRAYSGHVTNNEPLYSPIGQTVAPRSAAAANRLILEDVPMCRTVREVYAENDVLFASSDDSSVPGSANRVPTGQTGRSSSPRQSASTPLYERGRTSPAPHTSPLPSVRPDSSPPETSTGFLGQTSRLSAVTGHTDSAVAEMKGGVTNFVRVQVRKPKLSADYSAEQQRHLRLTTPREDEYYGASVDTRSSPVDEFLPEKYLTRQIVTEYVEEPSSSELTTM